MQIEYLHATNSKINHELKQATEQSELHARVEKSMNIKLADL